MGGGALGGGEGEGGTASVPSAATSAGHPHSFHPPRSPPPSRHPSLPASWRGGAHSRFFFFLARSAPQTVPRPLIALVCARALPRRGQCAHALVAARRDRPRNAPTRAPRSWGGRRAEPNPTPVSPHSCLTHAAACSCARTHVVAASASAASASASASAASSPAPSVAHHVRASRLLRLRRLHPSGAPLHAEGGGTARAPRARSGTHYDAPAGDALCARKQNQNKIASKSAF